MKNKGMISENYNTESKPINNFSKDKLVMKKLVIHQKNIQIDKKPEDKQPPQIIPKNNNEEINLNKYKSENKKDIKDINDFMAKKNEVKKYNDY